MRLEFATDNKTWNPCCIRNELGLHCRPCHLIELTPTFDDALITRHQDHFNEQEEEDDRVTTQGSLGDIAMDCT